MDRPNMEKGKLAAQPFFYYIHTRGSFGADGDYSALPDDDRTEQFQQSLFLQYGLTDRVEVDVQMYYQQNAVRQDGLEAHGRGLGDSYAFLKYSMFEEKGWRPHLTGLFQAKFPSGKYQKADPDKLGAELNGTGTYDYGLGLIATKKFRPFVVHADAIYSIPTEAEIDGVETLYGPYWNYDLAVEYFLPKGFNLVLEANGYAQGDTREAGEDLLNTDTQYLTLSPGIGWSCDAVQMLLSYQRVVAGVNSDANDSAALTFFYQF